MPTEWSFTSVDSGYTHPVPKELSAAELDAYSTMDTVTPVYVKIVGTLTISGYYYNVAIDGATIIGSITYPEGDLSAFNGKTVTIVGYITGVTGSGRYLNLIITSIS